MKTATRKKEYVKPTLTRVETTESISDLAMACCAVT